jgi:hypothetical protein
VGSFLTSHKMSSSWASLDKRAFALWQMHVKVHEALHFFSWTSVAAACETAIYARASLFFPCLLGQRIEWLFDSFFH